MKKVWKILLIMILLMPVYGCAFTHIDESNIGSELAAAVTAAFSEPVADYQNMNKDLYAYYLPNNIGHQESNVYSDTLICEGRQVLMSLNAAAVITDKYYTTATLPNSTTYDSALYSEVFSGTDNKGTATNMSVSVFAFDDNYYLVIRSRYFTFMTTCPLAEMPAIAKDVIRVARATSVNQTEVLAAYSKKESINYQQETTTMFSQQVPENGTLAEMLDNYFPDYDFSSDSEVYTQEDNSTTDEASTTDGTIEDEGLGE